MMVIAIAI